MRWQHWARAILALVALAVAVAVGVTFKRRRDVAPAATSAVRTDPKAVVESTSGRAIRFDRAHEEVRVEYARQMTYADGSTKLLQPRIEEKDRGDGRSFTLTADEGFVGKDETLVTLNGHITLVEGDGFTAESDAATYDKRDGRVRAPGDITFHHDRLSGSGHGMLYDKETDVLTIMEHAVTHMAPDDQGKGAADIKASTATFARMDHIIDFGGGGVHVTHDDQVIDSTSAITYLTDDDKHITVLELHGNAKIASAPGSAGSLQGITGNDVSLEYADDGQAIEHAIINGSASIKLSGGEGKAGREISANAINIRLAPDGKTPTELLAQGAVQLTLPAAEQGGASRTVKAASFTAAGDPEDPSRGLTQAHFTTNVEYREKSATVDRTARAQRLDVGLKPAMAAFDSALFTRGASFQDAKISGTAASLKYVADAGTLALSGSEVGSPRPHVANDQIAVDAATVDVTLAGPVLSAQGDVKSVLQPPKKTSASDNAKLPSMLKQDQAVTVTADRLNFDGGANKATYDGKAVLWQTDTSIKGDSLSIDSKSGDLSASGRVLTTTMLDQTDKEKKKKERVRSTASAQTFAYDDKGRTITYSGDVHFSQAENDMAAERVELFLKKDANEVERAEASHAGNKLELREQGRRTTGTKMTYAAADERYDVTGAPVSVTDQCGRVTSGRTLTFKKATETVEVDGNRRVRTQTKNGTKCQ